MTLNQICLMSPLQTQPCGNPHADAALSSGQPIRGQKVQPPCQLNKWMKTLPVFFTHTKLYFSFEIISIFHLTFIYKPVCPLMTLTSISHFNDVDFCFHLCSSVYMWLPTIKKSLLCSSCIYYIVTDSWILFYSMHCNLSSLFILMIKLSRS